MTRVPFSGPLSIGVTLAPLGSHAASSSSSVYVCVCVHMCVYTCVCVYVCLSSCFLCTMTDLSGREKSF